MTVVELESALMKCCQAAEAKGLKWASAKAICDSLEDKRKVILAFASPLEGTEAHKDREGMKSIAYQQFLEGLKEARMESNKAWVEYSVCKDKFEALRSILSNRREEFKRGL